MRAKLRLEEEKRRLRNRANEATLQRVIKQSEEQELKTFDLQDDTTKLNHELEISEAMDDGIGEYVKFEKNKNQRLQKQLDLLKQKIQDETKKFNEDKLRIAKHKKGPIQYKSDLRERQDVE